MNTRTVRVLRAFYFKGKPTKVGDIVELPGVFALEMCAAHKAELAEKPGKTTETIKLDTSQKGGRHAS